jgi:hypothetical protein
LGLDLAKRSIRFFLKSNTPSMPIQKGCPHFSVSQALQ